MSKDAVFTMKLENELREAFMAEADAVHRPASQVLRELMRNFIEQQRESRAYHDFLEQKIEAGRASKRAGLGTSNEDVEIEFSKTRKMVEDDN